MKTITYNLIRNNKNYYEDIDRLTNKVINHFTEKFLTIYKEYLNFIITQKIEKPRSYEEYIYDFLSAGVYLNTYSEFSKGTPYLVMKLLSRLYYLRRKQKRMKPYIDPVRGIISTMFLYKPNGINYSYNTINDFWGLIHWLEASGEFREEVNRFKILGDFLLIKETEECNSLISSMIIFGKWFVEESLFELGIYTENVEEFLSKQHNNYKWKENFIFTGRRREEYHLSMVGAELMNRGFRKNFLSTNKKALLIPACMRNRKDDQCKSVKNSFDMKCSGCDEECRVFQLVKLGKEKGFSVHIIPHSSDFTTWLKTWAVNTGVGVIGVACPLNLITGGLELKSLNIPAQCLLLDYCGCKNHWDENGFATNLNSDELLRILSNRN